MTVAPVAAAAPIPFTGYQKFVVAILAFLQFTIIIDFMILSPLGAFVMPSLGITPQQFGIVVSAYALAAGLTSFVAAGYADRFDRKRLLLTFYGGFMVGTLLCGLANSFEILLVARIVTGMFAGVIGATVMAIATDLFPMEKRGRVMGLIQTAFAASQVLGLPAGLYLTNAWDWHAPFFTIVVIGVGVGVLIALFMKPVDTHLALQTARSPFAHLWATIAEPRHFLAFGAVALLATGGYMLLPFGADFTINNYGIDPADLPKIYLVTGICMIFVGPLAGRAADKFGKYPVFLFGTLLSIVMVVTYTHLGAAELAVIASALSPSWLTVMPLYIVMGINVLLFIGIFSRIVPSQALMTGVPDPARRGAFNAVCGSLQQVAGGLCAALSGAIVHRAADGHLENYPIVGYIVAGAAVITLVLIYRISKQGPAQ